MRATDAFRFKSVVAGDQGPFVLYGGIYQISAVGFLSGSATLYQLGPDSSTYLSVSNTFVANGGDTIYLPPGQYKWTTVTDTLSLTVVRVPIE